MSKLIEIIVENQEKIKSFVFNILNSSNIIVLIAEFFVHKSLREKEKM